MLYDCAVTEVVPVNIPPAPPPPPKNPPPPPPPATMQYSTFPPLDTVNVPPLVKVWYL
jgi:hypothetical protein